MTIPEYDRYPNHKTDSDFKREAERIAEAVKYYVDLLSKTMDALGEEQKKNNEAQGRIEKLSILIREHCSSDDAPLLGKLEKILKGEK